MGDRFKIVFIGAGSFRFSLGLYRNILNTPALMPMDVGLCDIDAHSLDLTTKIFKRMITKAARIKHYDPDQVHVSASTERRDLLENADIVYKSISVGMQESEWVDNYLPLKFGIPQNTGDTLGPGGLFRSLRSCQHAAGIAKDMAELCPKAPLLSYTNPQGTSVMAGRTAYPGSQFIGLCHELFMGGWVILTFLLGHGHPKRIFKGIINQLEYGGLNHLGWITKMELGGKDYYPLLKKNAMRLVKLKFFNYGFNFYLLQKHGLFVYPGSRHVAEFLPDYYNYFNYQIQCPYWKFPVVRDVGHVDRERTTAYKKFNKMAAGKQGVPRPLAYGERAMEMTLDWKNDKPRQHVVNIPNAVEGQYPKIIPELPDDCIVEVPGQFKEGKMMPVKTIHLPEEIAALVRPHAEQMRFTTDAGLGNDMELVVKAMQHDPMANWIEDDDKLEYLSKLMLYYQKQWLPEAWAEWIPTEDELKQSPWFVSQKDLAKDDNAYLKVMFPPDDRLKAKAFFWPEKGGTS